MPRRSILSAAERASLLALPDTEDELIRHYTFSEPDLSVLNPENYALIRPTLSNAPSGAFGVIGISERKLEARLPYGQNAHPHRADDPTPPAPLWARISHRYHKRYTTSAQPATASVAQASSNSVRNARRGAVSVVERSRQNDQAASGKGLKVKGLALQYQR